MSTQEILGDINTDLVPSEINLKISDLPKTLQGQIRFLEQLKKEQAEAKEKAEAAKEGADNLEAYVRKKILGIKYQKGNTKEKIEQLQAVVKDLANAQESVTRATNISLKFQKSLSETTQFLLFLGCSNIASFNAVIDNINRIDKDGIGGSSISEEVKARLKEVVNSLKERQDVMFRQEKMAGEFKKLVEELKPIIENLTISSDRISKLVNEHHEEFIHAQKEFEKKITNTERNNERVQEEIKEAIKNTNQRLLDKESSLKELFEREVSAVREEIKSTSQMSQQSLEYTKKELEKSNALLKKKLAVTNVVLLVSYIIAT